MSLAAGTLYRRSVARVQRRAQAVTQARDERASILLTEAVRTTNRLAYAAGYAGPLAHERAR